MATPDVSFHLRDYCEADEDAAIALWQHAWQTAYPAIDFTARLPWWRARWRDELVATATIIVAEQDAALAGFVTIDRSGYLDQLVVDPDAWGSGLGNLLIDRAKQCAPHGITLLVNADNARAISFYERHGFRHTHDGVNPESGRPVRGMQWTP